MGWAQPRRVLHATIPLQAARRRGVPFAGSRLPLCAGPHQRGHACASRRRGKRGVSQDSVHTRPVLSPGGGRYPEGAADRADSRLQSEGEALQQIELQHLRAQRDGVAPRWRPALRSGAPRARRHLRDGKERFQLSCRAVQPELRAVRPLLVRQAGSMGVLERYPRVGALAAGLCCRAAAPTRRSGSRHEGVFPDARLEIKSHSNTYHPERASVVCARP
eukprot:1454400-Prymnesium_polylepis.2